MGYRKVGYMEQLWYILKYKVRELFQESRNDRVPIPAVQS